MLHTLADQITTALQASLLVGIGSIPQVCEV